MKKILLILVSILLLLTGCADDEVEISSTVVDDDALTNTLSLLIEDEAYNNGTISKDSKYNAAIVDLTPEEFSEEGFELGDSIDITFGNGYVLEDVPYYNGYYVKNGDPVIVAYPGFTNISITLNNTGIWDVAELDEGDTVTFSLNEEGKYLAIQESLGQIYSFDREDYDSDVRFANFRALTGGNLKIHFLYRGASPVDNSRGRASYVDALLEENNIQFIIDLADDDEDIKGYMEDEEFASPYTTSLYEEGKIALLGMGSSFESQTYKEKVVEGLREMLSNNEGPVYIHCMEGKDRTGFVCFLLEALANATYKEMRHDYMLTYANYYKVTKRKTEEKYNAIVDLYFNTFVSYLHDSDDLDELINANYSEDARNYLKDGGMSDEEIDQLYSFITVQ